MRKVAVTFLDRSFAETDSRLHTLWAGGGQQEIQRITTFEVRGPFAASGVGSTPPRARSSPAIRTTGASEEERDCAQRSSSGLAIARSAGR